MSGGGRGGGGVRGEYSVLHFFLKNIINHFHVLQVEQMCPVTDLILQLLLPELELSESDDQAGDRTSGQNQEPSCRRKCQIQHDVHL